MHQYLARLLSTDYMSKYSINVIDSKDINKVGLSESMARDYVHNSKAPLIIVMET